MRFANTIEGSAAPSIVELASDIRDLELTRSATEDLVTSSAQSMAHGTFRERFEKESAKQRYADDVPAQTFEAYFANGQRIDSATFMKLAKRDNPTAFDDRMCMFRVFDRSEKPAKKFHLGSGVYSIVVSGEGSGILMRIPANPRSNILIKVFCSGGFEQNLTVENFVKALGPALKDVRDLRLRHRINNQTVPERTSEANSRNGVG